MRIGSEERARLHSDDVAWVIEWQLATAFPWIPIADDSPVFPDGHSDPRTQSWGVTVRAGQGLVRIPIPLRDLARVICWCRQARYYDQLMRPPTPIRASLLSIRTALRSVLADLDPLRKMGYPPTPGPAPEV